MSENPNTALTILVIEPDNEVRPLLQHNLKHDGFRIIMTIDEEDAIERTKDGRAQPDVILLNQVGLSPDEVMQMGQRIRRCAGLPDQTAIVVMAERYEQGMEGKNIQVGKSEYVTYLEDAQQLVDFLHSLVVLEPPSP